MKARLLIGILLAAVPACAEDAAQILAKVAEVYKGMRAFRFEIRCTADSPPSDYRLTESFEAPDHWRYDFQRLEDDDITISRIGDGKTRWVVQPSTNEYTAEPFDRVEGSFARSQQDMARYSASAAIVGQETLTVNDEAHDCYVIRATLSGNPKAVSTRTFWIDQTGYLVLKQVEATSGADIKRSSTFTITVLKYGPHVRFSPAFFQFRPPDGFERVAQLSRPPHPSLTVGNAAPSFHLKDLNGEEHDSSEFQGKYLLLEFWGAWCTGCREQLPLIDLIHRTLLGPRFAVLGIATHESPETSLTYLRAHNLDLPSLVDVNNATASAFGIGGFPATYLIGPDGVILYGGGVTRLATLQEALMKAGLWPK
jgi:outer membrane lipoprotein-sorting protein/peroxiredoxin